jgi:hypothetical protein
MNRPINLKSADLIYRFAGALPQQLAKIVKQLSVGGGECSPIDVSVKCPGKDQMTRGMFVGFGKLDLGQDDMSRIGNLGARTGPRRVWLDAGRPMELGMIAKIGERHLSRNWSLRAFHGVLPGSKAVVISWGYANAKNGPRSNDVANPAD